VHVAAMALVLGGAAFEVPAERVLVPIVVTAASGVVLLGIELYRAPTFAVQGNGIAVWLKLAFLSLGVCLPSARFEWYLAATIISSIGSHMPGRFRHYSFVQRRVIEYPD